MSAGAVYDAPFVGSIGAATFRKNTVSFSLRLRFSISLTALHVKPGSINSVSPGQRPTLDKSHLLGVLDKVETSQYRLFILETNGILIGADPDYAREIARFKSVHTRVSLKAGTPAAFTTKTGAKPESFELPFQGIVNLLEAGASFHVAAMSADTRIMTKQERESLLSRLASIHPSLVDNLEEEVVDPYHTTLERLQHAGVKLKWAEY